MPATAEMLRAARALIDTPEKWTQRQFAKDAAGHTIDFVNPDAVCFCACGALRRLHGINGRVERVLADAMSSPSGEVAAVRIVNFNDTHTHAEVLAAFDRAIEEAERAA